MTRSTFIRSALSERRGDDQLGPDWPIAVLCALFFASGAAGLMYQVLWVRLLGLVFGVTVYAATAVLATFMGGLALGSVAADRLTGHSWHPLRTLGGVELSIGVTALASLTLLRAMESEYVHAASIFGSSLPALTFLRVVSTAAVLLVPTTLMGATFPLIVKGAARVSPAFERHPAMLYASNTAGAIVGALVCGLYTIGLVGIARSFLLGAALNVVAATGATVLALRTERWGPRTLVAHQEPDTTQAVPGAMRSRVLAAFFLSGLVSLGLEVAWFRILILFVTASTYAFTMMLVAVLAGLAIGSAAVAPAMTRWARLDSSRWMLGLAVLQALEAFAAIGGLVILGLAYGPVRRALSAMSDPEGSIALIVILSVIAIFPAAVAFGAAFPVGLQIWMADARIEERPARLGRFYAVNVCGAIAGSIVTGFALLPLLGSKVTILTLAALCLAGAAIVASGVPATMRRSAAPVAFALATACFAAAVALPDLFEVVVDVRYPGQRLVWKAEGIQATATVHLSGPGGYTMYLDGMHQASDASGIVAYHRRLAHLPLALHPNPRRVLVIGLGGGATAGAAAVHDDVTVDIVELSSTVVSAARWFGHINYDVLDRPNVRLRVDDARNYLLMTRERYDVVTADIIQPYFAGAGYLYSLEYFQHARDVLTDGGMMLQWLGNRSEPEYTLIMRTFLAAFPNATLWASGELLLGTKKPLRLDRQAFDRKTAKGALAAWYSSMGTGSFDDVLALFTAGPEEMNRYVGLGPVLTDDRPAMEFFRSLRRGGPPRDRSILRGDVRRYVVDDGETGRASVQPRSH